MMALVAGASLPSSTWRPLLVDEHILVVDKGAGLLTVPGRGEGKADCLLSRVRAAGYEGISHAAHRLDRDTSGIVACGRSSAAHKSLSMQFQERLVAKSYEALVYGWPTADEGEVDAWIGKVRTPGSEHAVMRVTAPGASAARPSRTRWRVVERCEESTRFARVALTPLTGRAHAPIAGTT